MISANPEDLKKIYALIQISIPDAKIFAYGSRVKGSNFNHSDLDLMIKSSDGKRIPLMQLGEASDLLASSNIPFRVDPHDYASTDPDFIRMIEPDFVEIK
jgi:predicted nucleotidyltransferase